ncbi:unnamed protein product [Prorocentrum cordatum]|uniref:DUF4116 domain-containing protein n=1 Tax=Prorocentrum cordatum TaxID=2364126 RepID=A0ABN9RKH3_9DINO|nr:unnamed protein product [Polarella glacialis]
MGSSQSIAPEFRDDTDTVRAACKKNGTSLEHASARLKDDTGTVRIACEERGVSLKYASERLKDDAEVVRIACKNDGLSIEYASDRLRDDKCTVLFAFKNSSSPTLLSYVSERLKDDAEVVRKACQRNPMSLEHASEKLKSDSEAVRFACQQTNDIRKKRNILKNIATGAAKQDPESLVAAGLLKLWTGGQPKHGHDVVFSVRFSLSEGSSDAANEFYCQMTTLPFFRDYRFYCGFSERVQ